MTTEGRVWGKTTHWKGNREYNQERMHIKMLQEICPVPSRVQYLYHIIRFGSSKITCWD